MKKFLSLLLTLCLLLGILPSQALAYVGDILPSTGSTVTTETRADGTLVLQNDYIRVTLNKHDGSLTTSPAATADSANSIDRQKPYCEFIIYGSYGYGKAHPATLRLKSAEFVDTTPNGTAKAIKAVYDLTVNLSGKSVAATTAVYYELVQLKENETSADTWGVLTSIDNIKINNNRDDLFGSLTGDMGVIWGYTLDAFSGMGHANATDGPAIKMSRTVYNYDEQVEISTESSVLTSKVENLDTWQSFSQGTDWCYNYITEVYVDGYTWANPFVGLSGYYENKTIKAYLPDTVSVTPGNNPNSTRVECRNDIGYYFSDGEDYPNSQRFLWGFRNLAKGAEDVPSEPDKVDISINAQRLAAFANGNGGVTVEYVADDAALDALKKQYGNPVALISGEYESKNGAEFTFTGGAALLSPSVTATWDKSNGKLIIKKDGTIEHSGLSLNAPSFKFYQPNSGSGKDLEIKLTQDGFSFEIDPGKNDAVIYVDGKDDVLTVSCTTENVTYKVTRMDKTSDNEISTDSDGAYPIPNFEGNLMFKIDGISEIENSTAKDVTSVFLLVSVDKTAPMLTLSDPVFYADMTTGAYQITGTADAGSKIIYGDDGASVNAGSDGTFTIPGTLDENSGVLSLCAQDSAGNKSTSRFALITKQNTATEFIVTFDGNGGMPSVGSMTTTNQKLTSLPSASQSKHSFDGWYTEKSGGIKITTDTIFHADTIVYAHWTYTGGGGGSSSGGSSSNDGEGSVNNDATIIQRPDVNEPNVPTTAQSEKVKTDAKGNVTITNPMVSDAIKAAKDDAKKHGNQKNGVAVEVPVEIDKKLDGVQITLKADALDTLVKENVKRFTIDTDRMTDFGFTLDTLKELNRQTSGDIILKVKKTTVSSIEAKVTIGNRPVYDISLWEVKNGKETKLSNLNGKTISIAIPYTPTKNEQTGNLYAVSVDGNGKPQWITKSNYNADQKAVIFELTQPGVYGVGYDAKMPAFTDIENHWAKDNILFVVSRGLLNGTSETTFSPNTGMTRGMFVTALGRLAGVDPADYQSGKFTDVKADAYYAPYVNWAAKTGIVSGTTDTTFAPDTNINREQMAVIMKNYAVKLGYTVPKALEAVTFADNASISSWAKEAVESMQQAGILAGKTNNRFDPAGTATRAEVATVLWRFVEIIIDPQTANG